MYNSFSQLVPRVLRPRTSVCAGAAKRFMSQVSRYVRFVDENGIERQGDEVPGTDSARVILGDILGEHAVSDKYAKIVKRLAPLPVLPPPMIFGIGLNYKKHAEESGANIPECPVYFVKNPNAVTGPEDPIIFPKQCEAVDQVDYEVELAIVIGKRGKDIPLDKAFDYVLGYTVTNDVSARDWQLNASKAGAQWNRGKSFDTFCPTGPVTVLHSTGINPNNLRVRSILNGKTVQDSNTDDLVFDIARIVNYCSEDTTLEPGTLILTGTPEGVGFAKKPPLWMYPGDTVECIIEGIGSIKNKIISKQSSL